MLIKYGEELYFFLISRGVPEYKYAKILSDTTLINYVRKNNEFSYNVVVSEVLISKSLI